MSASDLYERFLALHTRRDGFVMPNAWDGVSAQLFADAGSGFEAIGTSSLLRGDIARDHGDGIRVHEQAH